MGRRAPLKLYLFVLNGFLGFRRNWKADRGKNSGLVLKQLVPVFCGKHRGPVAETLGSEEALGGNCSLCGAGWGSPGRFLGLSGQGTASCPRFLLPSAVLECCQYEFLTLCDFCMF